MTHEVSLHVMLFPSGMDDHYGYVSNQQHIHVRVLLTHFLKNNYWPSLLLACP